MNMLMIYGEDFCVEDIYEAFQFCGHTVKGCQCTQDEMLTENSDFIEKSINDSKSEIVFTFNYFPSIATICNNFSTRYVSWVYDNPRVHLFSCTVIYPTNTIFVFEKDVADYFQSQGINTIRYLPLAADPLRLAKVISENLSQGSVYSQPKDITFVGSMYSEDHQLYSRMINKGISDYTTGYLRGIINAQKTLYGCDIITPLLVPEILSEMKQALPLAPDKDSVATTEYLFTKYVIDRQITAEERMDLLSLAGEKHDVHVFTVDPNKVIPNCINHGPAHSDLEAPAVYNSSKINLNITLRSIVNGIPLRAFEIMGSGGFLLTNYQSEFLDYFVPGEDFDYFESPEDMIKKIDYYLEHDDIRKQIASNGLVKIKKFHTFTNRIKEMNI